jgi:hypothetical protein
MDKLHSRYPYTYSCDFIRSFAGYDEGGTKISRADATNIRHAIANALGMDDKKLAEKISDYYIENEDEIVDMSVKELMRARNNR